MGIAFSCDLCTDLQEGKPVTTVVVDGANAKEDWCDDCFASYQDWRASMAPNLDEPEDEDTAPDLDDDAPVVDVPVQGRYQ